MTETAMATKNSAGQKILMVLSMFLALPLAGILLVHPSLMLDDNGQYSHRAMMFIMLGISGGFVYGVGFIPRFVVWKWLFHPIVSFPLMLWGYYTWLLT